MTFLRRVTIVPYQLKLLNLKTFFSVSITQRLFLQQVTLGFQNAQLKINTCAQIAGQNLKETGYQYSRGTLRLD